MDTKTCVGCGEAKALTEFTYKNMRKGLRHARCRHCTRAQVRNHYHANRGIYIFKARKRKLAVILAQREWILSFLELHPCMDCGESDPKCLDFDHVRGKKRAAISRMLGNFGWSELEKEIAKCEVRCANCHRKRTAERRKVQFFLE